MHNRGLRGIRALRNSQVAAFAFACGWLVLLAAGSHVSSIVNSTSTVSAAVPLIPVSGAGIAAPRSWRVATNFLMKTKL